MELFYLSEWYVEARSQHPWGPGRCQLNQVIAQCPPLEVKVTPHPHSQSRLLGGSCVSIQGTTQTHNAGFYYDLARALLGLTGPDPSCYCVLLLFLCVVFFLNVKPSVRLSAKTVQESEC